eukprot:767382-Hanusia_phi.AAC.3
MDKNAQPLTVSLYTSNFQYFAYLARFQVEARLFYDNGDASQCFDAYQNAHCLGVCETNGVLCDGRCPTPLNYSGALYSSLSSNDATLITNVNYTGLVQRPGCSYRVICRGENGVARCSDLKINRAGRYYISFGYPICPVDPLVPWLFSCGSSTIKSDTFEVFPQTDVPAWLQTNCLRCKTPQIERVGHPLMVQPKVLVVDNFGNKLDAVNVSVRVSTSDDCPNELCLPISAGMIDNGKFIQGRIQACNCLFGNLLANTVNGYATFTHLQINTAFTSLKLTFYYDEMVKNVSSSFQIKPESTSRIFVLSQPYAVQAGSKIKLAAGLFDRNYFLVSDDNSSLVQMSLQSKQNVVCLSTLCTSQHSRSGFVEFEFEILNSTFDQHVLLNFTSCQDQLCATGSIVSFPFSVLHSRPSNLEITQQPLNSVSDILIQPPPRIRLTDEYGNRIEPIPPGIDLFGFLSTCDAITLEFVCITSACNLAPIALIDRRGQELSQCCVLAYQNETNAFNCTHRNDTNVSWGYLFEASLLSAVEGEPLEQPLLATDRVTTLYAGASVLNQVTPRLLGSSSIFSDGPVAFSQLAVDAAGTYRLKFSQGPRLSISSAFKIFYGHPARLHVMNSTINAVAGRILDPLTTLVTDLYGNQVLNFTGQIHAAAYTSTAGLPAQPISLYGTTELLVNKDGVGVFSDLMMNRTGSSCTSDGCVVPDVRLFFTTEVVCNELSCMSNCTMVSGKCLLELSAKSFPFKIQSNQFSNIAFRETPPTTFVKGAISQVTVLAQDAYGNVVVDSHASICLKLFESGREIFNVTAVDLNDQQRSIRLLNFSTGQAIINLRFSASGSNWNVVFYYMCENDVVLTLSNVSVQVIDHLYIVNQPNASVAGSLLFPPLEVQLCSKCPQTCCLLIADVEMTVEANYQEQCAVSSCGLDGRTTEKVQRGVALFSHLNLTRSGYLSLLFSVQYASVNSSRFYVSAASPRLLRIDQQPLACTVISDHTLSTRVQVQDIFQNSVFENGTIVTIKLYIYNTSGTFPCTTECIFEPRSVGTVNGIATFDSILVGKSKYVYKFGLVLSYSPSATEEVLSDSFSVAPADTAAIAFLSQPEKRPTYRTMVAGIPFRYELEVQDKYGNRMALPENCSLASSECVAKRFQPISLLVHVTSAAQLDEKSFVVNTTNGLAHFNLTLQKVGYPYHISAQILSDSQCNISLISRGDDIEVIPNKPHSVVVTNPASQNFSLINLQTNQFLVDFDAGTTAYVDVQILDSQSNPIFDFSDGVSALLVSNPLCRKYDLASFLVCNDPTTGCLSASPDEFKPTSGLALPEVCSATATPAQRLLFHNGRARVAVSMKGAGGSYQLQICPSSSTNCSNFTSSFLEQSCSRLTNSWCKITPASTTFFTVLPLNLQKVTSTLCPTVNLLTVGSNLTCTIALSDQFGNVILGGQASATYNVVLSYNGLVIGSIAPSVTAMEGLLRITIPQNSSSFLSPFRSPATDVRIRVQVSSLAGVQLPAIFSQPFSVVAGDISSISVDQVIPVTRAFQNIIAFTLSFVDVFSNTIGAFNQTFDVAVNITGDSDGHSQPLTNAVKLAGEMSFPEQKAPSTLGKYFLSILVVPVSAGRVTRQFVASSNVFDVVSGDANSLQIVSNPSTSVQYEVILNPPSVLVLDTNRFNFSCPIHVNVSLDRCSTCASVGNLPKYLGRQVYQANQVLTFTDLRIDLTGTFRLRFSFCRFETLQQDGCPSGWSLSDVQVSCYDGSNSNGVLEMYSTDFRVVPKTSLRVNDIVGTSRNITAAISTLPRVRSGEPLGPLSVSILGANGQQLLLSVANVSVSLFPESPTGLEGRTVQTASSGLAIFTDLIVNRPMAYQKLKFLLSTPPPSTDSLVAFSNVFNVEATDVIHLVVSQEPGTSVAGQTLTQQPEVHIVDFDFNLQGQFSFEEFVIFSLTSCRQVAGPDKFQQLSQYPVSYFKERQGLTQELSLQLDQEELPSLATSG